MNQVPGIHCLVYFFLSFFAALARRLSFPPVFSLTRGRRFFLPSYTAGRSADLLSQLELVISLRHSFPYALVSADKTDLCVTCRQNYSICATTFRGESSKRIWIMVPRGSSLKFSSRDFWCTTHVIGKKWRVTIQINTCLIRRKYSRLTSMNSWL